MREYWIRTFRNCSFILLCSHSPFTHSQLKIMDKDWWVEEGGEGYQVKSEFADAMKLRTKKLVLRHIKLYQALPASEEARIIGKQLLRSASSTGANYRAACRARSQAEFFPKLSIAIEEADESLFWLEILEEAGIVEIRKLASIKAETTEILKILAKARFTLKEKS